MLDLPCQRDARKLFTLALARGLTSTRDAQPEDDAPLTYTLNDADISTVLRSGPYRFYFYAGDRGEPPHIHVERDDDMAKFWLSPVRLQTSGGFSRSEIARLLDMVSEYQTQLLEAWNAYFND